MSRHRSTVTIDRDAVSPDSVGAAQEYLLRQLEARATVLGEALDWNSYRIYNRRGRRGNMVVIAYARVLKP